MSDGALNPIQEHLRGLAAAATQAADTLGDDVLNVARLVIDALDGGNRLFFCGNGGSAADAQHLATEYVVRFRENRRALSALALTTDTSLLTAAANDLGFELVFARQIEALGRAGDILFLHTTSGQSPNLLAAADAARALGIVTIGMLARGGGALRTRVDHAIVVPTDDGAHAQEIQLALGHAICDMVDAHVRTAHHHAHTHTVTANQVPARTGRMNAATLALIHAARLEEKRQALYYRALAAAAEELPDADLSERLNGLHADEQHHLSRLTARLVELGEAVTDVGAERAPQVALRGWEAEARLREQAEIARYRALLPLELDEKTRHLIEQIVDAEQRHAQELGGKWMGAEAW